MSVNIPIGREHLSKVFEMGDATMHASAEVLYESGVVLDLIGTSLSALYQAATCHRKCYGGPHILEALAGRSYNLGAGAYTLIVRGLYDEGMNLIRSIAEISNLIAMSAADKNALKEWLASDHKTRLKKFSPAKVRKLLSEPGKEHPHFDGDWYSEFCEKYTHVNPGTKPNLHNEAGQAYVGGAYQRDGLEKALGELATVLGVTALMVCAYVKFDDLFAEISSLAASVDTQVRAAEASRREGIEAGC